MDGTLASLGNNGLLLLRLRHAAMRWAALFGLLALSACSEDDDSPTGGDSAASQACLEMADVVADAAVRACAQPYQANYDAFIQSAAAGDCRNVKVIRDEDDLRNVCLPWFATATCAQLEAASGIPAECSSQLLR
jgi:hypothetical protein